MRFGRLLWMLSGATKASLTSSSLSMLRLSWLQRVARSTVLRQSFKRCFPSLLRNRTKLGRHQGPVNVIALKAPRESTNKSNSLYANRPSSAVTMRGQGPAASPGEPRWMTADEGNSNLVRLLDPYDKGTVDHRRKITANVHWLKTHCSFRNATGYI